MSDILPPCELPSIGFGALPLAVGAASVAVAGIAVILSARGGRPRATLAVAIAIVAFSMFGGSDVSAESRPDCRVVVPNFAEVSPEDLIVSVPGETVPGEEEVIADPSSEPVLDESPPPGAPESD